MKSAQTVGLILAGVFMLSGCASPRGHTTAERREHIHRMQERTLEELYAKRPEAKSKIEQAAGYGVLSNIGFTALFLGAGNGYGVVVDNATGKETYIRALSGSAGLGLGVRDYRAVLVFHSRPALETFIHSGWDFGGEGEASAKLGESGGTTGVSGSFAPAIEVYQFTANGLSVGATLAGTKVWWDKELNTQ